MVYFWKLNYAKSTLTAVRSRLFCTAYPFKSNFSSQVVKYDRQNDLKYKLLITKSFMKSLNQDATIKEKNYAELWENISQKCSLSPALLRTFLESKYEAGCDMDYPATLECLKKANIPVDASIISTYIGFACNEGDMDLARHYLDELKLLGFVPNIITFSKVLQGYIRNKSSEEVNSTIKLMTSLNYWPSSIGYHNALVAYADNGDTQSFIKTFEEYEEFTREKRDKDGNEAKIAPVKLFQYYNHLVKSSSGLEGKEFILNKISEISERKKTIQQTYTKNLYDKLVYNRKSEAVVLELLLNHINEAKALLDVMKKVAVMPEYFLRSVIAEIRDVPSIETLLEACDLSADDQFDLFLYSKISDVPKIYEAMNFKSLSDHQKIFRMILGRIVKNKDVDALKDILGSKKFISKNYILIFDTLLRLGYDPKEAVNLFGKNKMSKESMAYSIILNQLRDSTYEDLEILANNFKKDDVLPCNHRYDKYTIRSKIANSLFDPKYSLTNLDAEKENILKKLDIVFGCINNQFHHIIASELVNYCIERHKSTENESDRLVQEADILIDSFMKNKIRFHNVEALKTLSSCGIKREKLDAINYAMKYNKKKLSGDYLKEIIRQSDYKTLHKFLKNRINSNQMHSKGFDLLHTEGSEDKKAVPFDIIAYMIKEMKVGSIKNDNDALYKTFAYCLDADYSKPSKQNISSLLEKFIDEKENNLVEMTLREVLDRKSISPLLFTQKNLESLMKVDAEKIWPMLMTHLNSKNNSMREFVLKATTVYSSFPKPPIESSDNKFGIVSWPSYLLRDYLNQNHMANVKMISDEMIRLAKSRDLLEAYYLRSWAADISIKVRGDTNLRLNSSYSFCSPKSQNIPVKLIKEAFVSDGKFNPLLLDSLDQSINNSSEKYTCNEIGRIIAAEWDSILSNDVFSASKKSSYKMTSIDKLHFISNILNSSESKVKLTSINLTTIVNSVLDNVSSVSKGIEIIESLCQAYHFNKYTLVSSILLGALRFNNPTLQTWLNDFMLKNSFNNDLQSAILSLAINYSAEKTSELCWDYETAEKAVGSILPRNKFSVVFDLFNGKFEPYLARDNLDLCCDIAVHSPKQFNRLLHEFRSDQEKQDYIYNKVFDALRCFSTPFDHRKKLVRFYKKDANNATLTSDNKAYILAMQSVKDSSPLSHKNIKFLNHYFSEASKLLDNQTIASELHSLLQDNNFKKADIVTNLKNLQEDDLIKISTPLSFVIAAKRGLNSLMSLLYKTAEMNLSNILGELGHKAAPIYKNCYGEAFYVLSKRMKNTPLNEMESQLIRFHFLNSFVAAPKSKQVDLSESVLNVMRNSVPDIAKKISEESLSEEDLKAVGANFSAMNGPGKTSLLLAWLTNFGDVKKVKLLLEHMPAEVARTRNPYVYFSECLNAVNNTDAVSVYNNCVKELVKESPQNISSCLVGPHVSSLLRHWPDDSIPSLLHLSNHFAISTKNNTFLMRLYSNLVGRGLINGDENIFNSTSVINETSTLDHFERLLSYIQHRTSSNPLLVPFTYLAGSPKYPLSSDEWNNVVTYVHRRDKDQLTSLIDLCLRNAALNAKVNDSLTVLIESLENLSFNEITKVYDLAIICQSSTLREIWMVTQFKKDKLPPKINDLLTDTLMKRGLLAKNLV